ncbi:MAG TPA: phosphoserine phosphatase SerB [Alphaproteobacteria bacterium]|nr:phosphoserine phosphatase SerB [Alphaproteobacteria bacterium]
MTHVLTFVAADLPLLDAFLESLGLGPHKWLKAGKAADILVSSKPDRELIARLREACAVPRVDFFVNERATRRKKLVLADMDSTIIAEETLDELAAYAGIKDQIAAITARAMNGELDFHAALRERVALLKGLPEAALAETLARMKVNVGAAEFIKAMADSGAQCILVSGGFTFFTGAVASSVGFHGHHGNTLLIEDGKLTGMVGEPILDKDSKLAYLKDYAAKLGISLEETLTIGDGANDLPMLKAAGLGIGYYPKKAVADEVDSLIGYGDFTAALYAQGLC